MRTRVLALERLAALDVRAAPDAPVRDPADDPARTAFIAGRVKRPGGRQGQVHGVHPP
jgi:hypothetical protein